MRVQGTPVRGDSVDARWGGLRNGELLDAAEKDGFDLLLTTDKNLRYQQNLKGRTVAIVVIGHSQWPALQEHVERVVEAVNAATPGGVSHG